MDAPNAPYSSFPSTANSKDCQKGETRAGDRIYPIGRDKFIKCGETLHAICIHVFNSPRPCAWRMIVYGPYNSCFVFPPQVR